MSLPDANAIAADAFRQEELGFYAQALEGYRKALTTMPGHFLAATRSLLLQRHLKPEPPAGIKILWQIDLATAWETEWIRYLLSGCTDGEIVDGQYRLFEDGCIVVDRYLNPERRAYYFELLKRGCRFALFHLSDEHYSDDCTAYGFANLTLRNYWSRAHANNSSVIAVPLGTMSGFRADARKTASERAHLWCFAGNPGKPSRLAMLAAMQPVAGGFLYGSNAVNPRAPTDAERAGPHPPLDLARYAQALSGAVFALCPAGWENLDSFRVCEALEAGCIPIVERRGTYDYFQNLFGRHPMPAIDRWNEAPGLIAALRADAATLEERRRACASWWQSYKADLAARVRSEVHRSLRLETAP
jgi:hypothetical protein